MDARPTGAAKVAGAAGAAHIPVGDKTWSWSPVWVVRRKGSLPGASPAKPPPRHQPPRFVATNAVSVTVDIRHSMGGSCCEKGNRHHACTARRGKSHTTHPMTTTHPKKSYEKGDGESRIQRQGLSPGQGHSHRPAER